MKTAKKYSKKPVSTVSTKHYPTGAELLEKAEKALQEKAKLDVTALENMTKGLSDLAEKAVKDNRFTAEQAKQELTLRARFLNVTKSYFANRLERGRALMEYQQFYTPLGMLSDFLKVVGVDRRTAYRWIDLAKAEREDKSGKSKQSISLVHSKQSPLQGRYLDSSMVPTVKDIVSYAKKAVKGLDEDDQKAVLRAVLEVLTDYRKTIGVVAHTAPLCHTVAGRRGRCNVPRLVGPTFRTRKRHGGRGLRRSALSRLSGRGQNQPPSDVSR